MHVTQMSTKTTGSPRRSSAPVLISPQKNGGETRAEKSFKSILSKFETDDYILAGLLIVLILEGCDDYILLAALGYLFIMGFKKQGD